MKRLASDPAIETKGENKSNSTSEFVSAVLTGKNALNHKSERTRSRASRLTLTVSVENLGVVTVRQKADRNEGTSNSRIMSLRVTLSASYDHVGGDRPSPRQ
jgi:hypothetical protein